VDACVQWIITDVEQACFNVSDFKPAIMDRAQLSIREQLSSMDLNDVLHNRTELSDQLTNGLSHLEQEWGIKVEYVQLKDIKVDDSMTRAMAKEAEAERTKIAKVINAEADLQTADIYKRSAEIYKENPISLRLRELQAWQSISRDGNTIYVIPTSVLDAVKAK